MNFSDVLGVLPDGFLLRQDFTKSLLSPDADITESHIGVVSEFKKLPYECLDSCVIGFDVFGDILMVILDAKFSGDSNIHSLTLFDFLRLMPADSYCSINSGVVCGEVRTLHTFLSPYVLSRTVAGISVNDDRNIEITFIDK